MMTPDQESTSSTTACPGPASNSSIKCSRAENNSVHVEPLNLASDVNDQMLDHEQQSTPVRFSILRQSLRPVTLEVFKTRNLSHDSTWHNPRTLLCMLHTNLA